MKKIKNQITDDMLNIVMEVVNIASENSNGDPDNVRTQNAMSAFQAAIEQRRSFEIAVEIAAIVASRHDGAEKDQELVNAAMERFHELEANPTEVEPSESEDADSHKASKKISKAILIFIGIVAIIGLVALGYNLNNKTETASPEPATQNEAFKQETDLNANNRVDTKFAQAISEAQLKIADGESSKSSLREAIMDRVGHNAHALAIYANAIGGEELWANPNDWSALVSEGYLSDKGEALYHELDGILKQEDAKIVIGTAPANGFNSGIDNGTYGAAEQSGVSGDRTAAIVTTDNGSTTIMKRCGNIVYPSKPELPVVPTDDTPRPKPPQKLEPKDPSADVLQNDKVADWKKNDNGEEMTVDSHESTDNGATVDNGLQKHPTADARDAAEAAEEVAEDLEEAHDTAVDAAVVVDTNNHKDEVTPSEVTKIDPNW